MAISSMVKVEGKVVAVNDGNNWCNLDSATDRASALCDAAAIRRTIEYAVKQHVAEEATSGGYAVTFPFKPDQLVRHKPTGSTGRVQRLVVYKDGAQHAMLYLDKTTSWPNVSELEAIPKTALEVLAEFRATLSGQGSGSFCYEAFHIKICELEAELKDAS